MEGMGEILLIDPATVQMFQFLSNEEIKSLLSELNVGEKKLVLIPINDNENPLSVGGTHWSLLMYNREKTLDCLYHLDSIHRGNFSHCKKVAQKLTQLFDQTSLNVIEMSDIYKQTNSYDCGMFLLANAEYLLRKQLNLPEEKVDQNKVNELRNEIIGMVENDDEMKK